MSVCSSIYSEVVTYMHFAYMSLSELYPFCKPFMLYKIVAQPAIKSCVGPPIVYLAIRYWTVSDHMAHHMQALHLPNTITMHARNVAAAGRLLKMQQWSSYLEYLIDTCFCRLDDQCYHHNMHCYTLYELLAVYSPHTIRLSKVQLVRAVGKQ